MRRSFQRVLDKLAEARFFYARFASSTDARKANFYFSAFVSAGRSVTFTIQAVCARLDGFTAWYGREQAALSADPVARFLLQVRNETQKVGLIPVHSSGVSTRLSAAGKFHCRVMYRFAVLDGGKATPPAREASAACRDYVQQLSAVVERCYERFPLIDVSGDLRSTVRELRRPMKIAVPQCPLDRAMHKVRGPDYRSALALAVKTVSPNTSKLKSGRSRGLSNKEKQLAATRVTEGGHRELVRRKGDPRKAD